VAGPGAGFTTGTPWLPLVADAERLCVERQEADPRSMLSLVRRLGELRAGSATLRAGSQTLRDAGPDVLAWERSSGAERLLVAVNFATGPRRLDALPDDRCTLLLSTDPGRTGPAGAGPLSEFTLQPGEGVLLELPGPGGRPGTQLPSAQ
jgi:alpha-glucosidase